jgi:catechol 2,3-dioxygenase-like lactoylglutathione lyase family enzyme
MVTALAHICFTVRNLEVAEEFYRDRIGLTPAFDFVNDLGERFGVYLHIGGRSFLELFQGAPHGATGRASYAHFCLEVEELAATVAELRAKGVEVSDPAMGADGSWQAWLADPDGNRIELHQYMPESKQAQALK